MPLIMFVFSSFNTYINLPKKKGSPFPIVLVPRYKLSLCHTPIKPDLLGFLGIGVFAYGLCDHVVCIIWYQSLAPLIRLYPSKIFIPC